jgi:hypothetical protein
MGFKDKALSLVDGLLGSGPLGTALDRLIPDVNARRAVNDELKTHLTHSMTEALQGQLEINKIEAAHPSVFVSGWRPAIGWICGLSLLWHTFLAPLVVIIAALAGHDGLESLSQPPSELLTTVLLGMLGLGGLRTFEKHSGVARSRWGRGKD